MDGTVLLVIVIAIIVALSAWGLASARRPSANDEASGGLATSTEGMKVCPKCGMGNLWTERRCSACGNALKG